MLKQMSWRLFLIAVFTSPVSAHATDARMSDVTHAGNTQTLGMVSAVCGVDIFGSGAGKRTTISCRKVS